MTQSTANIVNWDVKKSVEIVHVDEGEGLAQE